MLLQIGCGQIAARIKQCHEKVQQIVNAIEPDITREEMQPSLGIQLFPDFDDDSDILNQTVKELRELKSMNDFRFHKLLRASGVAADIFSEGVHDLDDEHFDRQLVQFHAELGWQDHHDGSNDEDSKDDAGCDRAHDHDRRFAEKVEMGALSVTMRDDLYTIGAPPPFETYITFHKACVAYPPTKFVILWHACPELNEEQIRTAFNNS